MNDNYACEGFADPQPIKPFASFAPPVRPETPLRRRITDAYRSPEEIVVTELIPKAEVDVLLREDILQRGCRDGTG